MSMHENSDRKSSLFEAIVDIDSQREAISKYLSDLRSVESRLHRLARSRRKEVGRRASLLPLIDIDTALSHLDKQRKVISKYRMHIRGVENQLFRLSRYKRTRQRRQVS